MKSLMMLWQELTEELGEQCGVSTSVDVSTVNGRVRSQGWSFMTIGLPQFSKDLERSLAAEECLHNLFTGFRRRGETPIFLGGFLDLIFHRGTGKLLPEPCIDSIHAIRQITLLYSKLELPTSEKREAAAMRGFLEVENDVRECTEALERDFVGNSKESLLGAFQRMSELLWVDVFGSLSKVLWEEGDFYTAQQPLRPKHGPGATADRLSGNGKFDLLEWPKRLERVFPYGEYCIPNGREVYQSRLHDVTLLEPEEERPVRVIAVPKTAKTPRIIAIEPTAMQYMQQGLSRALVRAIQDDENIIAGDLVGFDDQNPNRAMALEGSVTGSLATLDLSEASDRVSSLLVEFLTCRWGLVLEAFDVTRSMRADVQGEGIIPLFKYASMGSALTFPVEAMCFLTLVFLGIEQSKDSCLTRKEILSMRGQVRVYGDDIVVPSHYAPSVISTLETFGLKVNRGKSFWTGKFRESCGREYYDGHDVSVVKVRKVVRHENGTLAFPSSLLHASEIESFVGLRNRFYAAGLWRTARYLDTKIYPLLKGYFPNVEVQDGALEEEPYSRSRLLGRWSFLGYQSEWTHPTLFHPLVKGWVVSDRIPQSKVSGLGALQKVLSTERDEPFADRQHLERAGRPEAVYMKLRRACPF